MKLPYPMIDLACIPVHFVIGLVSRRLSQSGRTGLYACFLWPILGVPSYWLATLLFVPKLATPALIPILAFIGATTAASAFIVGLAIERRAKPFIQFLQS